MDRLRYGQEIRWLYQAALLLFLVTIALGMARGLGLIDFADRNQFLTHLHSGVIGWITLGIIATVLWIYGGTAARNPNEQFVTWTTLLLIVSVPIYIAAWWTGNLPFRAVSGALVLLGILLFAGWLVREAARIGYARLTTPQLGAVVGLVTLVVGSTLGVLLQIQFATEGSFLPGGTVPAHAETQITGYLVLLAMSIAYWRLHGNDRTARGTWMVWLFFTGAVFVAVAVLADILPLTALFIPLDITAFVLLLMLTWRRVVSPGWLTAGSARHYAIAIPFALVYLVIFIYLITGFAILRIWEDFSQVPPNLIPATEHPLFVGMVTNTLFGLLYDQNADRRRWPWADEVLFWGMNIAVAAFLVAILANAQDAFKIITPVLGLSLLVGIVVHSLRLWAAPGALQSTAAPPTA
jgi:uncharacterized protein (DUF486 family)